MAKSKRNSTIILIGVLLVAVCAVIFYQMNRLNLTDKQQYRKLQDALTEAAPEFSSNADMQQYLENWADEAALLYVSDASGNLIITKSAASGSETVEQTVICVDYNYKTAAQDTAVIATAQSVADTAVSGAPTRIIFLNNESNLHEGASQLDVSCIPASSNVIYLSADNDVYVSGDSYASSMSDISLPYAAASRSCNTGIRITISGIPTGNPTAARGSQPDPFEELNSILSRLSGKSTTYQIADLTVGNEGNMYPSSLSFTLLINSYDLESVTEYLSSQSENFLEDAGTDYPDLEYSFETIEDESQLPENAYAADTLDALRTFLYVLKDGSYRFDEDNVIEGYEEDDIYGANCLEQLYIEGDTLHLTMNTIALNKDLLDGIISENAAAAALADVSLKSYDELPAFHGDSKALQNKLVALYSYFNASAKNATLHVRESNSFTSCSLLAELQPEANIAHIAIDREEAGSGVRISNVLLNFIQSYASSGLLHI